MSNLKAIKRESTSSGSNNKLRAEGLIPAILYGGKDANLNISIQKKEITNIINSETFLSKRLPEKHKAVKRFFNHLVGLLYGLDLNYFLSY